MTESSTTSNGVESSPPAEEVLSTKDAATSAEEATVEESTSSLAPQAPSEASPENEETKTNSNKEEEKEEAGDRTDATEVDSDKKEAKDVEETKEADASSKRAAAESTTTTEKSDEGDDAEKKENEKDKEPKEEKPDRQENQSLASGPVVSSTKRTRPAYKYDPEKVTLRFLFANKDGLTVTVECKPGDTVGEVKGQLLSVWPKDLPDCTGGDQLRLICMGKGMLMPDTRTLEDCQVPVFKTHPTPVNVSVRPKTAKMESTKSGKDVGSRGSSSTGASMGRTSDEAGTGCGCVIQ